MFSKVFRIIVTCLVDGPVFRMFRNFQFIHQHSNLFWEHFKNILENFQDCSETFRFVFGTFQKCSGTLTHFQKYSETFWLVYCHVFLMFRNFQFISKHADLFRDTFKFGLKTFQKFVFGTFQKVFRNIKMFSKVFRNILTCLVDCLVFRMIWNFQLIPKHSDSFWKHFKK